MSWPEAVAEAVRRRLAVSGASSFTRQELIDHELDAIIAATGSAGATPHQTLSRELQQMRDAGLIEFVEAGRYRWTGDRRNVVQHGVSKGVFVTGAHSGYDDEPERFYRFPPRWLSAATKVIGNWIIYQEPRRAGKRGYYAVTKIEKIVADPLSGDMYLALIQPGTYLEFGRDVPFHHEGHPIERGLLGSDGSRE